MNIGTAIKVAIRPLPTKFRVYNSDLKIRIEPANVGVYPDALVICEEPQYWQDRRDVITNPLLIVEVLSPNRLMTKGGNLSCIDVCLLFKNMS